MNELNEEENEKIRESTRRDDYLIFIISFKLLIHSWLFYLLILKKIKNINIEI
jgi:hypothetical protein